MGYYKAVSLRRTLYVVADSTFSASQLLDAARERDEFFTIIRDYLGEIRKLRKIHQLTQHIFEEAS